MLPFFYICDKIIIGDTMDNSEVINKFNSYVKNCIEDLVTKKQELIANIECAKHLDVVSDKSTIGDLLSLKEYILKLEPKLANDIKILEFFSSKNSLNVPQVRSAYTNVLNIIQKNKVNNIKELDKQIKVIDKTIIEYNNYLNNSRFNTRVIIELVDNSKLSSDEQIIVLSNIAFNMSDNKEIEEKKETSEQVKESDDSMYYELLLNAKNILKKYYDVLANKSPQEMRDIINISQIIGSMNINDVVSFYNEKIVFEGLIYKIKSLVNSLLASIKNNDANKEDLYLELDDAIESLGGIKIDSGGKNDEKEINVYFLLDNVGNPLFSTNYDTGDLSKIDALINKLISVPGEIANGRLVQDTWLEANKIKAYVKNFSDMYCSYLKMTDNKILIIDFAPLNYIYDETSNIVKRNQVRISEIMDIVKDNNEEFNIVQRNFLSSFQDTLTSKGR